jgi:hypothetical protein
MIFCVPVAVLVPDTTRSAKNNGSENSSGSALQLHMQLVLTMVIVSWPSHLQTYGPFVVPTAV